MIDYDHDPHVSSLDMLLHYSIIPYSLYEEYNSRQCRVQWIWFYYEYMKRLPHPVCQDLFVKALEMVDFDIYDLRVINKEPPSDEIWGSFHESFGDRVPRDKYKLYGKAMVSGNPKVYLRHVKHMLGDLMGGWKSAFQHDEVPN